MIQARRSWIYNPASLYGRTQWGQVPRACPWVSTSRSRLAVAASTKAWMPASLRRTTGWSVRSSMGAMSFHQVPLHPTPWRPACLWMMRLVPRSFQSLSRLRAKRLACITRGAATSSRWSSICPMVWCGRPATATAARAGRPVSLAIRRRPSYWRFSSRGARGSSKNRVKTRRTFTPILGLKADGRCFYFLAKRILLSLRVDRWGFEPQTPALQTRCSTSWAIGPWWSAPYLWSQV